MAKKDTGASMVASNLLNSKEEKTMKETKKTKKNSVKVGSYDVTVSGRRNDSKTYKLDKIRVCRILKEKKDGTQVVAVPRRIAKVLGLKAKKGAPNTNAILVEHGKFNLKAAVKAAASLVKTDE